MDAHDSSAARLYRARTPLRVSFAGGGTDVPPYPQEAGGLVLSATISRYVYGTLRPRDDRNIKIHSVDLNRVAHFALEEAKPIGDNLDLIKAAIYRLADGVTRGFDLYIHSEAPPGSGLGSSSAVVVNLIGLLASYIKRPLTDYETAELALAVERTDLGLGGGAQDQYAAVFGGFNYIEFGKDRALVNPLRIPSQTIRELEYSLILCFTGATRVSDEIIDDQVNRFESGDQSTTDGLHMLKELATAMKDSLLQDNLQEFGRLLDRSWEYKKMMSPRITTGRIDELYSLAKESGALGGKVTGAGGGGYMLIYCPYDRKYEIQSNLEEVGAEIVPFQFDHDGLVTWSHYDG